MKNKLRQRLAQLEHPSERDRNPWQVKEWNRVKDVIADAEQSGSIDLTKRKGRKAARKLLSSDRDIDVREARQYVKLLREKQRINNQTKEQSNDQIDLENLYDTYVKAMQGNASNEEIQQLNQSIKQPGVRDALRIKEQENSHREPFDLSLSQASQLQGIPMPPKQHNLQVTQFIPIEEKQQYIERLNQPLQAKQKTNKLTEQTIELPEVEVVGQIPKTLEDEHIYYSRGYNDNPNEIVVNFDQDQARYDAIERALASGDLSPYFVQPSYFKGMDDPDLLALVSKWANDAVRDRMAGRGPAVQIDDQRLRDMRLLSIMGSKGHPRVYEFETNPLTKEDIYELQRGYTATSILSSTLRNIQRALKEKIRKKKNGRKK